MDDTNSAIMYAHDAGLTARNQMDPEQPIKAIQLLDDDGNPIRFSSGAGERGPQGPAGAAAGFGAPTATVDQTTGTATVTVSASGPDTAKVFAFKFAGLKGEKGDKGDKGDPGAAGASYTLPAATTTTLGGIKMANAIADPETTTVGTMSAFSTGAAPTEDNLNQVVTQVNNIVTALNTVIETQKEILAKLRGNGVIEQS